MEQLVRAALDRKADKAAVIEVEKIRFRLEFRKLCETNSCGNYNKCWMCPPDVGDIDTLIKRVQGWRQALVFQTIGQLKNSYDYRGMMAAAKVHGEVTMGLAEDLRPVLDRQMVLGAGVCPVCAKCAKREEQPCRFPDSAIPSLEAHGIAVSELAGICGMNYINGKNTVTYFSAIFFGRYNNDLTGSAS